MTCRRLTVFGLLTNGYPPFFPNQISRPVFISYVVIFFNFREYFPNNINPFCPKEVFPKFPYIVLIPKNKISLI